MMDETERRKCAGHHEARQAPPSSGHRRGWRVVIIAVAAAAELILVAMIGRAHAHDWNHPELNDWYSKLQRPNMPGNHIGFTSCCSKTDCHTTEAELRGDDWWARIGIRKTDGDWDLRDWVKVPQAVVLQQHDNPTGEGVICHSTSWAMDGRSLDPKSVAIWCFVPPVES